MPTIRVIDDNVIEFIDSNGDVVVRERYDETASQLTFEDGTGTAVPIEFGAITTPSLNGGGTVTDGDGVERDIYIIAAGASDPAEAGPEDIIFEEEA